MENEFPLFPELSKEAANEAQELINNFKKQLIVAADEAIGNLYCDILPYIESDSWTNFRNDLMDGFKNYNNKKIQSASDFKEIRQAILANHREDIINDLNQDMLKEIADLKQQVEDLMKFNILTTI